MKKTRKILLCSILWFGILLSSCATPEVSVQVVPPSASIFAIDGQKAESRSSLGVGEATLKIDDIKGKILLLEDKSREPMYILPINLSPQDKIVLQLKPRNDDLEKKISALETQLDVEKRSNQALTQKIKTMEQERHRTAFLVARLQNVLNQSLLTKANAVVAELFQIEESLLPAAAYTLRGKLRILEQKRNEARQDFTRALQIYPQEVEAKILLESLK